MTDIVERLRGTLLDKDNFPRMNSETRLPVGLAKEAADEIERLRKLPNDGVDARDRLLTDNDGMVAEIDRLHKLVNLLEEEIDRLRAE
jgi:hypothetical protein